MFDIGFSELLMVALVALLVLGPERLPKAARLVGLWVRRARAQWHSVKSELERDLAAEELQSSLREGRDALHEVQSEARDAGDQVRREFDQAREPDPPPQPGSTAAPRTADASDDDVRR